MLGVAVGCIGMSMDDFCRCTPSEFRSVYDAWLRMEERREHSAWERMRMGCVCVLQPWSKSRLRAEDVMLFPWEVRTDEKSSPGKVDREEVLRRYRAAKAKVGLV